MNQTVSSVTFPPTVKGNIIFSFWPLNFQVLEPTGFIYISIKSTKAFLLWRCLHRMLQKSYCLFAFMGGAYFYFVHFPTKNDLRNQIYLSKSVTVLNREMWHSPRQRSMADILLFLLFSNSRREDWFLI